jgi:hypothetical protein
MALALFPIFAVVFPFALDPTITDPKLLLVTSKQRGVAFVALDILIGTVILSIVPCWIPPAVVAVWNPPRRIGGISRAAQNDE